MARPCTNSTMDSEHTFQILAHVLQRATLAATRTARQHNPKDLPQRLVNSGGMLLGNLQQNAQVSHLMERRMKSISSLQTGPGAAQSDSTVMRAFEVSQGRRAQR